MFFFFRAFVLKFRVLYKSKNFLFNLFMDCIFMKSKGLKLKHFKLVLYFFVVLKLKNAKNLKCFNFYCGKFLSLYKFYGNELFFLFLRNLKLFCGFTLIKSFVSLVFGNNKQRENAFVYYYVLKGLNLLRWKPRQYLGFHLNKFRKNKRALRSNLFFF
jgi:hypothetical protein